MIGESGSGKSTIALAIMGLIGMRGGKTRGSLLFEGRNLLGLKEREMRRLRGRRIAMVPQSPVSALNPVLRLETHLREAWRAHSPTPWREARPQVCDLLREMGLPADDNFLRRYPAQVSVGQAQRVLIAMAVLHRPALLVADEPTSALDPSSQRDLLDLLRRLNRQFAMSILYISHDLPSVTALCSRIGVLKTGAWRRAKRPSYCPSVDVWPPLYPSSAIRIKRVSLFISARKGLPKNQKVYNAYVDG